MFENLSEKLEKAFKILKGQGSISEINVAQTMKEIRKALLAADVDFKTAKNFTNKVKDKAMGEQVLTAVEPGQLLTKIMRDELAELMGSKLIPNKSRRQSNGYFNCWTAKVHRGLHFFRKTSLAFKIKTEQKATIGCL